MHFVHELWDEKEAHFGHEILWSASEDGRDDLLTKKSVLLSVLLVDEEGKPVGDLLLERGKPHQVICESREREFVEMNLNFSDLVIFDIQPQSHSQGLQFVRQLAVKAH